MPITPKQVDYYLQQGESYNVEFKENFTKEIGKEICAFANANGGRILIGVTDKGYVKGFDASNKNKSRVQSVARSIEPGLEVSMEVHGDILVMEVPEGLQKPYSVGRKNWVWLNPH